MTPPYFRGSTSPVSQEMATYRPFKHKNQACPLSLSQLGMLRSGAKADLLGCLESNFAAARGEAPGAEVTIFDGAVVVNFLKPNAAKTFDEYAMKIFLPYVHGQLQHASQADVVWDQYREGSPKSQTREKSGKGVRRRIKGRTNLPGNWQQSMPTKWFTFLVVHLTHLEAEKQVVTTNGGDALCNPPQKL